MKGFTIYSLSKHAELGSLLESYCQRIGKLSSSNHDWIHYFHFYLK